MMAATARRQAAALQLIGLGICGDLEPVPPMAEPTFPSRSLGRRSLCAPMNPPRVLAILVSPLLLSLALAAESELALGQRGKLLLEENFNGGALPAGWARNTGKIAVVDGVLHAS